jgi:hypothetical protein
MEGGFFLLQRVELEQYGLHIRGLEIIGHDRPFREATRDEVTSRFYDNTGNTLGCVYELDGEVLTIWAGEKGSPAFYRRTFSPDGDTLAGA